MNPPEILHVAIRKRLSPEFALDVEFSAAPGFTVLFGPSGAGKTTLLDCIAGLKRPDWGRIRVGRELLFASGEEIDLPIEKRNIGYVFQDLALFPHLTVEENVGYGLARVWREGVEKRQRVAALLASFRIARLLGRKPAEISGGERQRVALARSLMTQPQVLLLDEPLSGLDRKTKLDIAADLKEWSRQVPVLYVTHSYAEAFALGERVIGLAAGKISGVGAPEEVLGKRAANFE